LFSTFKNTGLILRYFVECNVLFRKHVLSFKLYLNLIWNIKGYIKAKARKRSTFVRQRFRYRGMGSDL